MVSAPSSDNGDVSAPVAIPSSTLAPQERAAANFAANRVALERNQPTLLEQLSAPPDGLQWVLARDGSLTALHADGSWWAGCSLPWRAARSMFKSLKLESLFGCFLAPAWAAQLRLCLDMIEPRQALLAACPNNEELAVMLHCESFAEDIAVGRLMVLPGWIGRRRLKRFSTRSPGWSCRRSLSGR